MARGASELRTATVATGADLPYGVTFTLSHALNRTTRFQLVGGDFIQTETNQREWPVGNIRWSRSFLHGPFATVAVGAAVRRREGTSVQENRNGPPALTSITSSSISPDLQLGLHNGLSFTMGLTALGQDNLSNGNETRLDQNDVSGSLNYAFRLPRSISRTRRQLRSSLSYLQTSALTCLHQGMRTTAPSFPMFAAKKSGGARYRPAVGAERVIAGGIFSQRSAALEPPDVANLDHRIAAVVIVRGGLPLAAAESPMRE